VLPRPGSRRWQCRTNKRLHERTPRTHSVRGQRRPPQGVAHPARLCRRPLKEPSFDERGTAAAASSFIEQGNASRTGRLGLFPQRSEPGLLLARQPRRTIVVLQCLKARGLHQRPPPSLGVVSPEALTTVTFLILAPRVRGEQDATVYQARV